MVALPCLCSNVRVRLGVSAEADAHRRVMYGLRYLCNSGCAARLPPEDSGVRPYCCGGSFVLRKSEAKRQQNNDCCEETQIHRTSPVRAVSGEGVSGWFCSPVDRF